MARMILAAQANRRNFNMSSYFECEPEALKHSLADIYISDLINKKRSDADPGRQQSNELSSMSVLEKVLVLIGLSS